MTLVEKILEANKRGWFLLNMFQVGDNRWRVNLHFRQPKGNHVSEFSEGTTADEAFDACWNTAQIRMKAMQAKEPPAQTGRWSGRGSKPADKLTPEQEAKLERQIKALFFAVKMRNAGTRSND